MKLQATFRTHQTQDDQPGGDILGNHRGDGNARDAQVEPDHQDQVQNHVDHAGYGQIIQWLAGIAHRPQNGRAKVIHHAGRDAQEENAQI